jgi:hypothetical protein
MLACQSSASRLSNQDSSRLFSPRRAEADARRLGDCLQLIAGSSMKPAQRRLFAFLACKCLVAPIVRGESDTIATVGDNAAEIAREIGLDRCNVSRTIGEMVDAGWIARKGGRLWISMARVVDMLRAESFSYFDDPPQVDVVNPTTSEAEAVVKLTTSPVSDLQHASIEDAGAPARSIRMNSNSGELNSDSGLNSVCLPDSSPESAKYQDDTHTHMNARLKHPLSPEEETRIIAFCDKHFPMMAVAENYLTNCRGLFPASWVVKALKRAKLARKCRWAYVREIMRSWECVGGPDPGEEDRYDDDMIPIPVEVAAILPIPTPSAPAWPISQRQRTAVDVAWMKEQEASGIDWAKAAIDEFEARQRRIYGDRA